MEKSSPCENFVAMADSSGRQHFSHTTDQDAATKGLLREAQRQLYLHSANVQEAKNDCGVKRGDLDDNSNAGVDRKNKSRRSRRLHRSSRGSQGQTNQSTCAGPSSVSASVLQLEEQLDIISDNPSDDHSDDDFDTAESVILETYNVSNNCMQTYDHHR